MAFDWLQYLGGRVSVAELAHEMACDPHRVSMALHRLSWRGGCRLVSGSDERTTATWEAAEGFDKEAR